MQSLEAALSLAQLDRGQIESLIRDFWSDRLANAAEAIRLHTAPDVVFRIIGGGELAFRGQEAAIEAVRDIDTNLEFLSFEILDLIVDGRKAALLWRATLANRGTGVTGALSVFDLITIENGLISSYVEFLDSDGFQKLMRGEPQPGLARRANSRPAAIKVDLPAAVPVTLEARDRTEAMLRAWWERRVAAGGVAVDEHFTADGELHLVGDPETIPFARHHAGAAEVRALVEQIDMEFAWVRSVVGDVLVSGDRAAVHWMADVRHRGTGAQGRVQAFDHYTLQNGRIRAMTEFFDTASTATWIEG